MTEILHENNPQVMLLTETQLRSNSGINIKGYTFFSRKQEGKTGGGVGILVHNNIRSNTATHISDRNIEIIWISVRRKGLPPVMIGTYYGKQESRSSKAEIELEMNLLKEEITEMSKEGEILLTMDGNAKIGLLGEDISRNGNHLLKVFKDMELTVMNKSTKCNRYVLP